MKKRKKYEMTGKTKQKQKKMKTNWSQSWWKRRRKYVRIEWNKNRMKEKTNGLAMKNEIKERYKKEGMNKWKKEWAKERLKGGKI